MASEEYKSHTILLSGGCVAAVAITKQIAEQYAKATYKNEGYTIVVTTKKHMEYLSEGVK